MKNRDVNTNIIINCSYDFCQWILVSTGTLAMVQTSVCWVGSSQCGKSKSKKCVLKEFSKL